MYNNKVIDINEHNQPLTMLMCVYHFDRFTVSIFESNTRSGKKTGHMELFDAQTNRCVATKSLVDGDALRIETWINGMSDDIYIETLISAYFFEYIAKTA